MDGKSGKERQMYKSEKLALLQLGVESLYQDKMLCDVQLLVEQKTFSAHRTILAAMSDYFRAMLGGGFKESNKMDQPIVLEGISASGFEVILDAIYTMELKLSADNILDVIPIACMLQIKPFIQECEDFLISSMDIDNVFTYAAVAERFSLRKAVEYSVEYKKACFPEISQTIEFKELDVQEVVNYLSIPDLFLHGKEMTAFYATIGWLDYKPDERKNNVLDLFQCINLLQISKSDITDNVSKVKLIMENSECEELIQEAVKYHEEVFTQPFYEGKIGNTRGVKDGLVVFPFWFGGEPSRRVIKNYWEIFGKSDPQTVYWTYLAIECNEEHTSLNRMYTDYVTSKMPETFDILRSWGPVKVEKFLYLFKIDHSKTKYFKVIPFRYNPHLDEWITLEPVRCNMRFGIFRAGRCSEKHILFIGTEKDGLSSVYYIYSIADNKWRKGGADIDLTDIIYTAYLNGTLYITHGYTLLSYDMENDAWLELCEIPLTSNAIGDCSFVGHDKRLFVLPSHHDPSCFEYNVETKCSTVFPNPILDIGCTHVSDAFATGSNVYVMLDYFENDHWGYTKHSRNILCSFDTSKRKYTPIRDLPCFCDTLFTAPMILPRP